MPKVGEKFQFGTWNLDENCPLALMISGACHLNSDFERDDEIGFEVIEVGEFIVVKFWITQIEVRFPAKYWNEMTFTV